MDVTVVVGTFGSQHWVKLAERAIRSAESQAPVIHRHESTLAEARNAGLAEVKTEWVVHLDADDELEPGYIEAMAKGTADLRAPSVRYVRNRQERAPVMPRVWGHTHDCTAECLRYGNWMVIGTCLRTELARSVGWQEFGWSEDWGMFAGCWKAGGTVEAIPEAVYRAHTSRRGRNRVSPAVGLRWHREIEKAIWPDEPSVL